MLKFNLQQYKKIALKRIPVYLYCGVFFLVGALIGCVLGLYKIHEQIHFSNIDYSWIVNIYNKLIVLTPNTKFLSDVAAFEAVVLAFFIPLSIEIVSKISERYKSEVIISAFDSIWENKILPWLLIFNIIFAISLRFLVNDDSLLGFWRICAWIVFVVFIGTAVIIFRAIAKLKKYMTNVDYILEKLSQNAEKIVKQK